MKRGFRNLLDPVSAHSIEHPLRTGAIFLTVVVLIVAGAVVHKLPFIDSVGGYTVTADFAKTNDVDSRSPVRVNGVDVGIVTGVSAGPNPQQSSQVKMQITSGGVVVHSDASASIRWRDLLGGTVYVDLNPGSPDAPRLNGPIPVSRTSYQVEFDDLTRIYNGNSSQAQRSMIAGTAKALSAPTQIGTSIHALPDLTTVGAGLKPYGGVDAGDLSKLVTNTAKTATSLGASVSNLQSLVSGADATLAATDAQRVNLGEVMQLSPGTLQSANVTGKRLDTTLAHLDPLVNNLDPGVKEIAPMSRALGPALTQANAVLDISKPLLRNAKPALVDLKAASIAGTPLLSGLQPTLTRLNSNILPWLDAASPIPGMLDYETIGPTFSALNSAGSGYDTAGYRIRAAVLMSTPVAMLMDAGTVLGGLTGGTNAINAACRQIATSRQRSNCSAVTDVLSRIALGSGGTK